MFKAKKNMGRPRKPKKTEIDENNVFVTKLEKQVSNTPVTKVSSGRWVNWGSRNNYPTQLLNLYAESPTLKSCVSFAVTSIMGQGIDWKAMQLEGSQLIPNYRYSWNEFLRRISLDYMLFGSFSFQVIKNRDGRTYSFYHQPIEQVRCSPKDDDGVITSYWICPDWSAPSKYVPVEIDALEMRPDEEWKLRSGKPYLYVYNTYDPRVEYYSVPCWSSSIKAVQAECEMLNYDLKTCTNSFVPAGALQLPYMDTEEQKQAMIREINNMFVGTNNANSLLISFANGSDDEPVKFTPFAASSENVDLFNESDYRSTARILESFCIPSRTLIGLQERNTGFSSQGELLQTAFNLYQLLAGNHNRNVVVGVINECMKANGIETELVLKPLSFLGDEGDSEADAPDTQEAPEKSQDITEDTIEEQES